MSSLIAVKEVALTLSTKRDLLLFDKIAVPKLNVDLEEAGTDQDRADIEFLVSNDVLFDVPDPDSIIFSFENSDGLTDDKFIATSLTRSPIIHTFVTEQMWKIFQLFTLPVYLQHGISGVAQYLQTKHSVTAIPQVSQEALELLARSTPDPSKCADGLDTLIQLAEKSLESNADSAPFTQADINTLVRTRSLLTNEWRPVEAGTRVLDVVLENLPAPAPDTALEDLMDFRADSDARLSCLELRNWMRKLAIVETKPVEAREELDYLVATYADQLRRHKIRSQGSVWQSLVVAPLEILENLVKLDFSKAAQVPLTLRERRLKLSDELRTAPGHEVAYLFKAKEFVSRTK